MSTVRHADLLKGCEINNAQRRQARCRCRAFASRSCFNNIAELIHKKAGLPYIPKTDQERTAENALRRELLVDWVELFTVKPAG